MRTAGTRTISTRTLVLAGIVLALVLAGVVSYYASSNPDGLEYVAEQHGFADTAQEHASADSPLADYATTGVEDPRVSGAVAGVAGTLLVLLLAGGTGVLLRRRTTTPGSDSGSA